MQWETKLKLKLLLKMTQQLAHAAHHILLQFQFQFHQLQDNQKDIQEMKTEIVYKSVLMIHFHQAVLLDIHQMAMETAFHLNQWFLVLADIHKMKMEIVNQLTKRIHQHKLSVKLELTVMELETAFQIQFQLFVILIIIVMEMATVFLKQYLYQAFAHMDINLTVMEIVCQKIVL